MEQVELQRIAQAGLTALQRGDPERARDAFGQVVAAGAATPRLQLLLAQACVALQRWDDAREALDTVLAAEPRNLEALVLRGDVAVRLGDDRGGTAFYRFALGAAEAAGNVSPTVSARLRQAEAAVAAADARYSEHLRASLAGADAGERFEEAVGIVTGALQPQLQQPTSFFYPGLAQQAFFDPAEFAWAGELAARAGAIRAELEAVLADEAGLIPYVAVDPNRPSRGHALLGDPSWSAYHLWENGAPVAAHAARCPETMAALAALPMPRIVGRSPMALFSVLRGGTHIPPHHGMLNTRLIVHLPLIVPPACRLRVGNTTRAVEAGKLLIFDDSMEHEAWNDSAETRVVLLFEVWRPELSPRECDALTRLFECIAGV